MIADFHVETAELRRETLGDTEWDGHMLTVYHREMPPEVVRAFSRASKDYFAETDPHRRDAIAARQLSIMRSYQGSREKPLLLSDVRAMFEQTRDR